MGATTVIWPRRVLEVRVKIKAIGMCYAGPKKGKSGSSLRDPWFYT